MADPAWGKCLPIFFSFEEDSYHFFRKETLDQTFKLKPSDHLITMHA